VNVAKEAPATASGTGVKAGSRVARIAASSSAQIAHGRRDVEKLTGGAKATRANAASIVKATGTNGPTSALDAVIGVTAVRQGATIRRSIPHLARRGIAECARAAPVQMDARNPECVIVAREARVAPTDVTPDRVSADPS
jgi:hypothetical protein